MELGKTAQIWLQGFGSLLGHMTTSLSSGNAASRLDRREENISLTICSNQLISRINTFLEDLNSFLSVILHEINIKPIKLIDESLSCVNFCCLHVRMKMRSSDSRQSSCSLCSSYSSCSCSSSSLGLTTARPLPADLWRCRLITSPPPSISTH